MLDNIEDLIYIIPVLLISLTVHEYAHALASYKLGDKTAKSDGRLSLNPLKHIDMVGFFSLIVFGFGWAKPVNINSNNYKNPIRDTAIVAASGPISNFLMAFIGVLLYALVIKTNSSVTLIKLLSIFISYNVVLGVFNLFPIPPLDGSKILAGVLPDSIYYKYLSLEKYGFIIIFALLFFYPDIFDIIIEPVLNFYNTILLKLI